MVLLMYKRKVMKELLKLLTRQKCALRNSMKKICSVRNKNDFRHDKPFSLQKSIELLEDSRKFTKVLTGFINKISRLYFKNILKKK